MYELVIRPDWAQQISQLRERLTEDTHIIRWGNSFYRCCRNGTLVALRVFAPDRSVALQLQLRPSDLYIIQVGSATDMGRYGSLTGELSVSAPKFEHAVRSLASGTVHGDEAFGLRSLVVFCVAEALRFDSLAYDIGFALRTVDVAGAPRPCRWGAGGPSCMPGARPVMRSGPGWTPSFAVRRCCRRRHATAQTALGRPAPCTSA